MGIRRTKRSVLLVPLLTLGLVTMGTGTAAHADGPCDTSSMTDPGPTDMKAHGTTHFSNSSSSQGSQGGGQLTWSLRGRIPAPNTTDANGQLGGFFRFTIDWDDNNLGTTSFDSFCVVTVDTSVGHLQNGTYAGNIVNPPVSSWGGSVHQTPDGSQGNFSETTITLDRVTATRADLHLDVRDSTCGQTSNFFTIHRNNAQALGDKTGNGGRSVCFKG